MASAELGERYPAISVVVLSAQQDGGSVVRALDLGALGFIPKIGPA
jgi:DNA-binding NarL/FixJ family response regulator